MFRALPPAEDADTRAGVSEDACRQRRRWIWKGCRPGETARCAGRESIISFSACLRAHTAVLRATADQPQVCAFSGESHAAMSSRNYTCLICTWPTAGDAVGRSLPSRVSLSRCLRPTAACVVVSPVINSRHKGDARHTG